MTNPACHLDRHVARSGETMSERGEGVRRCLVSGQTLPRSLLVRFVCDPDGRVVPDVGARLPGRGLWIEAQRKQIARAVRGKLFQRALRHRRGRETAVVAADLADQVEALLVGRCVSLLGLGQRSGQITRGFGRVSEAMAGGRLGALIIARDAGMDGREKLSAAVNRQPAGPTIVGVLDSRELSAAVGRENAVYLGFHATQLCARFLVDATRLSGFRLSVTSGSRRAAA